MKNKKIVFTAIVVIIMIVAILGASYAFFAGNIANNAKTNVVVLANSVDNLTFTNGNDISIIATQSNFGSGAGNLSGSTTTMVSLTSRNDAASSYLYQVYLHIDINDFIYTNGSTPELTLTVTKNGVTVINNMDITTENGIVNVPTALNGSTIKHTISANAGATTTDTYVATVTFVNLNTNQSMNAGATLNANFVVELSSSTSYNGTIYRNTADYSYIGDSIVPTTRESWCAVASQYGLSTCTAPQYYMPFETEEQCQAKLIEMSSSEVEIYRTLAQIAVCEHDTYQSPGLPSGYETSASNISGNAYIKHVVVNDMIRESYACVRYDTNKEACIKGGNLGYYGSYDGISNIAVYSVAGLNPRGNIAVLENLRPYIESQSGECMFNGNYSRCSDSSVGLTAYPIGDVTSYDDIMRCYVDDDSGGSVCN